MSNKQIQNIMEQLKHIIIVTTLKNKFQTNMNQFVKIEESLSIQVSELIQSKVIKTDQNVDEFDFDQLENNPELDNSLASFIIVHQASNNLFYGLNLPKIHHIQQNRRQQEISLQNVTNNNTQPFIQKTFKKLIGNKPKKTLRGYKSVEMGANLIKIPASPKKRLNNKNTNTIARGQNKNTIRISQAKQNNKQLGEIPKRKKQCKNKNNDLQKYTNPTKIKNQQKKILANYKSCLNLFGKQTQKNKQFYDLMTLSIKKNKQNRAVMNRINSTTINQQSHQTKNHYYFQPSVVKYMKDSEQVVLKIKQSLLNNSKSIKHPKKRLKTQAV